MSSGEVDAISWTDPITITTDDVIDAATWNAQIRDNERYLKGLDGTIAIEDSISMVAGKTVDGVDISAHQAASPIDHAYSSDILGGWVPAGETWTYGSATTITVPAGATSKYGKGDKIKLTQTTVKYFSVVTVADTLLTVTGGSDYSVANAAITSPYYSKVENPQGFPDWFNWTPSYSASGSMTFTSVTTRIALLCLKGRTCILQIQADGTVGGTPSESLRFSLPIAAASQWVLNGAGVGFDGGITLGVTSGNLNLAPTTVVDVYKHNGAVWTAGAAWIGVGLSYPIA